ncbi:MAG: stage III sporulation protein AE [Bacillota bacterium]|nr:stage III sporulation protein AE [Bacillota bacterium]
MKMCKKAGIIFAVFLLLLFCSSTKVFAEVSSATSSSASSKTSSENSNEINKIYNQQLKNSGADGLGNYLSPEAKKALGVTTPDYNALSNITFGDIIKIIFSMTADAGKAPISSVSAVLAIILICALAESFKTSLSDSPLSGVMGMVSTVCVATALIIPIVGTISRATEIITGVSNFMLAYIPIMAALMISSGQIVSGGSYYTLMMGAGQAVAQISSKFLVPLLNIFLGLSVTCAISPRINLNAICDLFYKVIKWVLGIIMVIFSALLTVQNILGTAADTAAAKAAKFAISSAVPVVGSALGDALTTVQSCTKLLKSGVGVFAIFGTAFMFLPILLECIIWLLSINICVAAGELFELKETVALLKASGKVINTIIAILICCMVIFIVTTAIVLIIGGAST